MNSTTKTQISDEKVKEIINYYFPQAQIERVEEMTGGMQNAAWFLLLNDPLPQKLILKIGVLPDADVLRYEKNNLYAEKECFQKLKNENIPIPELLVFDDTKQFLESRLQNLSRQCIYIRMSGMKRNFRKDILK